MQETRFEIRYHARAWKPWELRETFPEPRVWFQRKANRWLTRGAFDTRDEAEWRMKEIVEGEKKIRPTYYDQHAEPMCNF